MKNKRVLPGFHLSLTATLLFFGFCTLLPIGALAIKASGLSWREFVGFVTDPRAVAAYQLTLAAALCATAINLLMGLPVAWVLARYQFPGRRILDAMVDLPFALPTAVAGLTLATLTNPASFLGKLAARFDISIAYAFPGIVLAMAFTSFPFVVRLVQPVLEDLDEEIEEAASSLGAGAWKRFRHVVFPEIAPALLAGGTLAFVRSLGEFGAIVFISGNMPFRTEVASLLMFIRLDEFDYGAAAALASVVMAFSLLILAASNFLQARMLRRRGGRTGTRRLPFRNGSSSLSKHQTKSSVILIAGVSVVLVLFLCGPLASIFHYALRDGFQAFLGYLRDPSTLAALRLSLLAAFVAVVLNTIFGVAAAWATVRFDFPGRKFLVSLIELPLSLSPILLGVAYLFVFGMQGFAGPWLASHDIRLVFNTAAVVLVTTMVTSPFVFREILPVMQNQGSDDELAAASLGARGWRIFRSVTLPNIKWALLYGMCLCFTRSLGEFGSVAVVSGAIRGRTNTLTLQIDLLFHDLVQTGAFAVASILTLTAIATMTAKWLLELQEKRARAILIQPNQ
jgi:sulfate ABC transporter permease protein CysT/sulfate ABC transporter permease protein CysW